MSNDSSLVSVRTADRSTTGCASISEGQSVSRLDSQMLLLKAWPTYNKARARPARGDARRRDAENSGTERRRTSYPIASWPCTVILRPSTHREYQVEEEQQVLDTSHAAGHHFRHSHCKLRGSLNRTTRDVGARKNKNTLYSLLHAEAEKRCGCSFSYSSLTRLPFSFSLSFDFPPYTSTTRTPRYARALTVRRQMHPTMYFCCCAVYTRDARAAGQGRIIAEAWRGFSFFFFFFFSPKTKKVLGSN